MRGFAYARAGEAVLAQADFKESVEKLESLKGTSLGEDRVAQGLALAYAALGRKADAITEAEKAMAIMPPSRDRWAAALRIFTAAWVHAELGEAEAAADLLWSMKDLPTSQDWKLAPAVLQADPRWDPVRDHPRFRALLEPAAGETR
jgi:serine/threonine-protein kinase